MLKDYSQMFIFLLEMKYSFNNFNLGFLNLMTRNHSVKSSFPTIIL